MNLLAHPKRKLALRLFLLFACLLALSLLAARTQAAVQALSLPWWTVDSGGKITGGSFTLFGAIGQPDAGKLSGGAFKLTGGFLAWPAGPPLPYKLYLPSAFNS